MKIAGVTLVEHTHNEDGPGYYQRCLGDELAAGIYYDVDLETLWRSCFTWNLTLAALLGRAADQALADRSLLSTGRLVHRTLNGSSIYEYTLRCK